MEFINTFNQIIVLFLLLMTGFVARKLNLVEATFSKNLSNFLFYIVIPARIIDAMNYPFSASILIESSWLMFIGLSVMIFSYLVAVFVVKLMKPDPLSRNIYEFAIMFPNFGFMGYPVVEAVFGEEGVFYAVVFNIASYLLVNSLGIMLIKRGKAKSMEISLKNVVNPPIIAVVVGFGLFLSPVRLPVPLANSIEMIGMTTSPLSMILAGLILANAKFSQMFSDYKVYVISFIRLILLPMIVLILLRMTELKPLSTGIAVIITAMPVAANTSILAEKFNGNAYLGAQCVFISTLLSMITIPVIVYFL